MKKFYNLFELYYAFEKGVIEWDYFKDIGIDDFFSRYLELGYGLYMINVQGTKAIYFEKADSPEEAYKQFMLDIDENYDMSEEDCITDEDN